MGVGHLKYRAARILGEGVPAAWFTTGWIDCGGYAPMPRQKDDSGRKTADILNRDSLVRNHLPGF